jgi:hypothetical protein
MLKLLLFIAKNVIYGRRNLKLVVILNFMSKYFVVLFPTTKTTNFYPLENTHCMVYIFGSVAPFGLSVYMCSTLPETPFIFWM